ncbi:hypothetical protein DPM19_28095 [Actinomadura craniellae]|uniref:DUF4328 domain-containing protein n=1 Tax=Actinomadura craniellae TaxID=2231787 RepID=A0A365GYF0_9ACTN|nr:DUF4328 domain-containing protein [Actinomadura craniellae]RAY11841.1 hypothetical protein DPM19_28095 [Actinomadura craniellae]
MPCTLCGDIIPTQVTRCPACGAWARRRDFRAVGVAVFMMLGFNAFVSLGTAIGMLRLVRPLDHITRDTFDPVVAGRVLAPYGEVFTISGALAAVTGVLYLAWLWRAHAHASGPRRHRRSWVVAGWFCPIANLWVPPRLVHDVWVSSGRLRTADRHAAGMVVAAWWLTLLAAIFLTRLFPSVGFDSLASARFSVQIGIAAAAMQALAAALCMATVFHITRLQIEHPTVIR